MFVEAAVLAYVCQQPYNMEGAYVYGRTRSSGEFLYRGRQGEIRCGRILLLSFFLFLAKKRKPGAWGNGHDSRFQKIKTSNKISRRRLGLHDRRMLDVVVTTAQ